VARAVREEIRSRQFSRRKLWMFRIVILLIVATVLLIGGEFAARYREIHRTEPPDFFPSIFYPHQRTRTGMIPNLDYYGWFKINSLGLRGEEVSVERPPNVFRIACLGASTTFDIGSVGKDLPWPEVLQKQLRSILPERRIEVINLGIPGCTSLDSLINLQFRALDLDPDLVIFYHAHNDINYSTFGSSEPTNSEGLFPSEQRPRSRTKRWLLHNSLLYAKGRMKLKLLSVSSGTPKAANPELFEQRFDQGARKFRANLTSFLAICAANDIAVVLPEVVISYREDLDPAEKEANGRLLTTAYWGQNPEWVTAKYAIYNEIISELAKNYECRFVSTSDFVPGGDKYFHDVMHFNGTGSRAMGDGLAKTLITDLNSAQRRP